MRNLKDKMVLVTGASSGIGAAIAREAARQGARVALVARRKQRLARIADGIHANGGVADVFDADLSDPAAVEAIASVGKAVWFRLRSCCVGFCSRPAAFPGSRED